MMKLKKKVKREKKKRGDAYINIEGQLGNPIF